jgi:hypothetical protein
MGEVLQFVRRRNVFGPDMTSVMGEAYDEAMATLCDGAGTGYVIRELVARRIVTMARNGEVDRERLCKTALSGSNRRRFSPPNP